MKLFQRIKDILFSPTATWPLIEAEDTDTKRIFTGYVMNIALVPAIASFIGMSFFGIGIDGTQVRVPLLSGLANAVVSYLLSLVMIYLLAKMANKMAPTFGGRQDPLMALKLIAYSSTAAMLGGIFSVFPSYAALGLAPTLYSVFLLARGIPVLMKSAPDRTITYTSILLIATMVSGTLIGAISATMR